MTYAQIGAPWLQAAARVFHQAGETLHVVGGAVRNPVMGVPISDVDVCGPARPERVMELCEGTAVHAHLRAAHFGTVELHVTDERGARHMAEYTTFREDSYRCGHRPSEVRFTTELAVDALRRDFSVNAMYRRAEENELSELIDPTGGLAHLAAGELHTVTENPDRVLADDGLRILRMARFAAELGLEPTERLIASAERHAQILADIARERLRDELEKIMLADFRYPSLAVAVPATVRGLRLIARVGAWPYVFQTLRMDADAVGAVSAYCAPEGVSALGGRLAVLFWQEEPETVLRVLQALRFSNDTASEAGRLCKGLQALQRGSLTPFEAVKAGSSTLLHARAALAALSLPTEEADALLARVQGVPLSLKALAVNGSDLSPLCAGLPPRTIGWLLETLWWEAVEKNVPNRREALLCAAERALKEARK
ncbi:MAG: CCA tRNA nucleotidyltransferase [Clostridia bacterium]|nr:CCA tRNA nucleotidyltransferase [Clostridia bacterium]